MRSKLWGQSCAWGLAFVLGLAVVPGCVETADNIDDNAIEIVGGDTTDISLLPWQVSLQGGSGYHFCGGTIVAPTWIVTAAHCVDGGAPSQIMAGATRLSQSSSGQVVRVLRAIQAPGYSDASNGRDLALLELDEPLDLDGTNVRAIKPVSGFYAGNGIDAPGVDAVVSGWGSLSSNGSFPDSLQSVEVPIVSLADASSDYGFNISSDQIPAGVRGVGGRDSCQGDSGGPLVVTDEAAGETRLAGVVSWGYGCADADYPGLYARVSSFFDLIDEHAGGLPTASAGSDQSVTGGDAVTLDASESSDIGVGSVVAFQWVQTAGENVDFNEETAGSATAKFSAPNVAGDLEFELTITDDGGNSATDTVIVTVDVPVTPPDETDPPDGPDDETDPSSDNAPITGGCAAHDGGGTPLVLLLVGLGFVALTRRRRANLVVLGRSGS